MLHETVAKTTQTNTKTIVAFLTERCKTVNHLKQFHAYLLKLYHPQDPSTIAPILSFSVNSKNPSFFSYACSIFQRLQYKSTFVYNTVIRGYTQSHLAIPAISCYKNLLRDGIVANNYTFTPLIKACSMVSHEFKQMGFLVHAHVVKLCLEHDRYVVSSLIDFYTLVLDMDGARMLFDGIPERDVVLWTSMIDGYGKAGKVAEARALFEEMPERNVISWSSIMTAHSWASDFKEVLLLYKRLEETGVKPNESVLVTVLTACAHLGALSQGMVIHSFATRCGYGANSILATALVDMYSKCGSLELSFSVFKGIDNRDSGAWNTMIYGFAMNGYATKSLELFDDMVLSGTQPSEATFVAVLSACTHASLVDKGLLLFDQMSGVYKVEHRLEHYACVVDLLARAGRLEDAEKFIEEKVGGIEKGDANVWGALLGACRVYGNTVMGDRIWRKLAEMGIADQGTHVLSYNMYREAGWDMEARRVWRLIEDTGMKHKPGYSFIEVNGLIEEFFASDFLHPNAQDIFQMLDSLFSVMYQAK